MKSLEENMEDMLDIEVSETPEGGLLNVRINSGMSQKTGTRIMSIQEENCIVS